jgi:magnesium chelatase family protein
MLSKVYTTSIFGLEGYIIAVETDISSGMVSFFMVGLPDLAVRESRERVSAAIKNNGFFFPAQRITINLAPADIKKEGSYFDLPIAIGILLSSSQIYPQENVEEYILLGELSLDGSIKGVKGVLPMVLSALRGGYRKMIVPKENAVEAALVGEGEIYAAETLYDVVQHLCTAKKLERAYADTDELMRRTTCHDLDFSDVKGQEPVKRAMEIAAAGGHNLLMIGPPGSGKTMLAKRFPTILPDMGREESLETTKIYSVAGLLNAEMPMVMQRPFRSPHHTISGIALVGGGRIPKPGEVSLAHNGVLFLDEFAEFQSIALEGLRQPMEDGRVTIARGNASVTYPASFMLLASMNPCPCGYYNDPEHTCHCTQAAIDRYLQKISGPILDRIDIIVQVNVERYEKLQYRSEQIETSAEIKQRIERARAIQEARFGKDGIHCNAQMTPKHLERWCGLGEAESELMKSAFSRYRLSARGFHRILKLARTIADLQQCDTIGNEHLTEALQYRGLDKQYFR